MTSPIYLVKLNLIFFLRNHYIFFGLLSAMMVAVWPFVLADDSVLSLITNRNLKSFCGFVLQTGLVSIDGWLKLTAPAQTAVLFKQLRLTLHSVLKELIRKPEVFDNNFLL